MNFDNLDQFNKVAPGSFGKGPAAMLIAEDNIEVASSMAHLRSLGFRHIFVLAPPDLAVPPLVDDIKVQLHVIRARTRAPTHMHTRAHAQLARRAARSRGEDEDQRREDAR